MDPHEYKKRLRRSIQLLRKDSKVSPENKRLILEYGYELKSKSLSLGRISKYITTLKILSRVVSKSFLSFTTQDLQDLVIKIDSNERWKEWTKRDFKLILRLFARWLNKRYNLNLDTSFININVRNKVKLPEEILTEDDVRKLVNFCDNLRDKAFIYTFYESGARVGEFLNLRLKHVEFVEHGAFLTFTKSKTKPRKIRVINSAPLLKMWIECHPFKNNPEAWLWITEFNRRQKRRYTLLMYKGAQIAEETSTKKWH